MTMQTIPIQLKVNGTEYNVQVPSTRTLTHLLRDDLGLTGTKVSCGEGECGACSVLLNGKAVNSCLVLAVEADGCEVLTVEGLATPEKLDPLQEAMVAEGAVQCGYCTPGVLMSAKGLLLSNPEPTEEQIMEALEGNICRCTGYERIIRAVQAAARSTATAR